MIRHNDKTLYLTQISILTALTAILTFFSLKIGLLEITLASIPMAVGAILLGPAAGAILGAVFGCCSFIMCFGLSPFGVALFQISPFFTFLVCVPTRILAGYLTGIFARLLNKTSLPGVAKTTPPAFAAPVLNTLLFMSTLLALFLGSDVIQSIVPGYTFATIMQLLAALAGINAVTEAAVCTVVSSAVCLSLRRYLAK